MKFADSAIGIAMLLGACAQNSSPSSSSQGPPGTHTPCTQWDARFNSGFNSDVLAMGEVEGGLGPPGLGPALYVGGFFAEVPSGAANGIAKWDGTNWSALGSGLGAPPNLPPYDNNVGAALAFVVFDDGHGPALYVGGNFVSAGGVAASGIARWNGASWSALGTGVSDKGSSGTVRALQVFDDGSGPALYAGGTFSSAGGVDSPGIAKWNGTSWSAVESGVNGHIRCMTVFDDGPGPALYVGGDFNGASGVAAYEIAKWNGTSWSGVGNEVNYAVNAITVFNDGTGPALYAAGDFDIAGGLSVSHIAKLNAGNWLPLGSGLVVYEFGTVNSLAVFNDGSGSDLYVGGALVEAGGLSAYGLARWNGASWSTAPGTGIHNGFGCAGYALSTFDGALFAGGTLISPDITFENCVAGWNGAHWTAAGGQGEGIPSTLLSSGGIEAMKVFDDGSGENLYVSGPFEVIGGVPAGMTAKWNGTNWSALDSEFAGDIRWMEGFDDGSGAALYAGGEISTTRKGGPNNIVKWNGANWLAVGDSIGPSNSIVLSLLAFDDGSGPGLYVGGAFSTAGAVAVPGIARWNGTSWSAVGGGVSTNRDPVCHALTVFDDGSGPALYAGTNWTSPGGGIAKWNGASWSELGSGLADGMGAPVVSALAMAVLNDGSGPALYVAGNFASAGGIPVQHIAKWNGTAWSALGPPGDGIHGNVNALTVFDDGSGSALYATGLFHTAGHISAESIVKWNGSTWSPLGSGLSYIGGGAHCLAVFNDGGHNVANLYVGGPFDTAGGLSSSGIAEWHGCAIGSFCSGDGTTLACPCANAGDAGRGCNNSATTGGASLQTSGTTSPDQLVLTQEGELPSALSIFLQGTIQHGPVVFGNGLRCIGGTIKRLYAKHASSGTVIAPDAGDPSITARSAALGDTIPAGATRVYQVYYRDPSQANCPSGQSAGFNLGNALKVLW
jgi:trimeric autotransporter adhesin